MFNTYDATVRLICCFCVGSDSTVDDWEVVEVFKLTDVVTTLSDSVCGNTWVTRNATDIQIIDTFIWAIIPVGNISSPSRNSDCGSLKEIYLITLSEVTCISCVAYNTGKRQFDSSITVDVSIDCDWCTTISNTHEVKNFFSLRTVDNITRLPTAIDCLNVDCNTTASVTCKNTSLIIVSGDFCFCRSGILEQPVTHEEFTQLSVDK